MSPSLTPDPFWSGLLDVPAPLEDPATGPLAPPDGGGALRVADTDLPALAARATGDGDPLPVAVVLTGGAAQVSGPAARCTREPGLALRRLELALRDTGDLAGNARRVVAAVDAARGEGVLEDEAAVHVAVPDVHGSDPARAAGPSHGWLAAADELAAAGLALALSADGPPGAVVARIDAALDRETPFTASVAGPEALLGLLAATTLAFDGDPEAAASAILDEGGSAERRDPASLVRARRWLRAATTPDPAEALAVCRRLAP